MPYPRHIKIVFRGVFNNTPEEFSFSTKWDMIHTGDPDGDIGNIDASGVRSALQAFIGNSRFCQSVWVTGWRAYEINADGRMDGNPRIVEYIAADFIKGTSSTMVAPQLCLAVTTEGANRGPARLGRFYLPSPASGLGSDCRINTTDQANWVLATTTFLKAIADSIDVPASPVSTSMVNVSPSGAGVLQTVQKIRVGRVLDTQRRRRESMLEEYAYSGVIDW